MKNTNYIVRIPEPCHQDWNNMEPVAQGKFCGSCNKVVFDFSNKTDTEIRDLLISYKDQKVCGHFKKTQIDRPLNFSVNLNQLPRNISSSKAFAIAVFLVFGTFLFSCTNQHGKKIGEIEVIKTMVKNDTVDSPKIMMGEVQSDASNESLTVPLPETQTGTSTIEPMEIERYIAGGLRFEQVTVEGDLAIEDTSCVNNEVLDENQVIGLIAAEPQDTVTRDSSVKEIPKGMQFIQVFEGQQPDLLVYPNPGTGEFTIKYDVLKRSNLNIAIFDMKGAWLKTVVNIPGQYEGKYEIPLNLNELPNGIYLVNMINDGKRATEKLILDFARTD